MCTHACVCVRARARAHGRPGAGEGFAQAGDLVPEEGLLRGPAGDSLCAQAEGAGRRGGGGWFEMGCRPPDGDGAIRVGSLFRWDAIVSEIVSGSRSEL